MKTKKRPTYSPELRLETAQLVVDQNYSQEEAAKAMSVAHRLLAHRPVTGE